MRPHNISLGHPHAPAPSMLYPASDIDWRFNSYMIVYMLECHLVGIIVFRPELGRCSTRPSLWGVVWLSAGETACSALVEYRKRGRVVQCGVHTFYALSAFSYLHVPSMMTTCGDPSASYNPDNCCSALLQTLLLILSRLEFSRVYLFLSVTP